MSEIKIPTQTVDLPSKGWFYPPDHPLSSGQVDLKYMTAMHEDILTSRNLIVKGTVIDKLLEALIATEGVKISDLLIGDKNGLIVASRIFGYGREYEAHIECPSCGQTSTVTINLEELKDKEVPFDPDQRGKNEFNFELPVSGKTVTFRLLTHGDEKAVRQEIESLKKGLKMEITKEVTTRMRHAIIAVDGDRDRETVRRFVDLMPSMDSKALREYARSVNPDVDLTIDFECQNCGQDDRVEVPIDATFFWPNARV